MIFVFILTPLLVMAIIINFILQKKGKKHLPGKYAAYAGAVIIVISIAYTLKIDFFDTLIMFAGMLFMGLFVEYRFAQEKKKLRNRQEYSNSQ